MDYEESKIPQQNNKAEIGPWEIGNSFTDHIEVSYNNRLQQVALLTQHNKKEKQQNGNKLNKPLPRFINVRRASEYPTQQLDQVQNTHLSQTYIRQLFKIQKCPEHEIINLDENQVHLHFQNIDSGELQIQKIQKEFFPQRIGQVQPVKQIPLKKYVKANNYNHVSKFQSKKHSTISGYKAPSQSNKLSIGSKAIPTAENILLLNQRKSSQQRIQESQTSHQSTRQQSQSQRSLEQTQKNRVKNPQGTYFQCSTLSNQNSMIRLTRNQKNGFQSQSNDNNTSSTPNIQYQKNFYNQYKQNLNSNLKKFKEEFSEILNIQQYNSCYDKRFLQSENKNSQQSIDYLHESQLAKQKSRDQIKNYRLNRTITNFSSKMHSIYYYIPEHLKLVNKQQQKQHLLSADAIEVNFTQFPLDLTESNNSTLNLQKSHVQNNITITTLKKI